LGVAHLTAPTLLARVLALRRSRDTISTY
jgi:hypothetical protein